MIVDRLKIVTRTRLPDVGVLVLALVFVLKLVVMLPRQVFYNDFAHFYVSSCLYRQGCNPYATPLNQQFAFYGFHFDPNIPFATNPPVLLLGFAPLTFFPPKVAYMLWVLVQALSLALILGLTRRILGDRISARGFWFLCAGVVGSATVYWHFRYSQAQLPLAALVLAAFAWLKSGKRVLACSTAMVVGLVKLYPLTLMPWFIWHGGKDARERLKLAAICLLLAGLTVGITDPELWREFFQRTPEVFKNWIEGHARNYSVPALLINLGFYARWVTPSPQLKGVVWAIAIGSGCALLLITYLVCWYYRHGNGEGNREKEFALLCVAMLAGSLIAWEHYLVFLIFPFALVATQVAARPSDGRVLGLGATWLALNCMKIWQHSLFLSDHLTVSVIVHRFPLFGMLWLGMFLVKELRPHSLWAADQK